MKLWKFVLAAAGVGCASVVLGACSKGGSINEDDSGMPMMADASTGADGSMGGGCPAGQQSCNGNCTPVALDPANCGACGKACAMGEVCSQGTCALNCGGGTTKCGMTCNDTNTDPQNCGMCGNKCAMGEVCSMGKCALACAAMETKCGMACVDTKTDRTNCGMCGTLCAAGEICSNGACVLSCQQGLTKCTAADGGGVQDGGLGKDYCANLQSDNANCGACNNACPQGQACVNGTCTLQCGMSQTKCGNACVNTQSDNLHCGACNNACPQGKVCSMGQCTTTCGVNLTQCGQSCVDILNDATNCGACANACSGANSTPFCKNGTCGFACNAGFLDCNGGQDGCEVNSKTDNAHCGACNNACSGGNVCSNGTCLPPGCAFINNLLWCRDSQVSRSCNTLCTSLGLGNPSVSDMTWFNAQSTQQLCTQIGNAFGLGFNSVGNYAYACAEASGGQIFCSSYNLCPASHRTTTDTNFNAICPCK